MEPRRQMYTLGSIFTSSLSVPSSLSSPSSLSTKPSVLAPSLIAAPPSLLATVKVELGMQMAVGMKMELKVASLPLCGHSACRFYFAKQFFVCWSKHNIDSKAAVLCTRGFDSGHKASALPPIFQNLADLEN